MASKQDLLPHIFLPVPDLTSLPKPTTKEDRLKTTISNLDKQHQAVRLNIIEAAKQKLEAHHAQPHTQEDSGEDEDRMDISPSSPGAGDMSDFLSNLSAPYEEDKVDELHISSKNPVPVAGISSKPAPFEIQLAKETLDKIALYDEHAAQSRKQYIEELQRERSRQNSHAHDPRLGSRTSSISYPTPLDPRNLNGYGGRGGGAASPLDPRVSASPIDGRPVQGGGGTIARPSPRGNASPIDPRVSASPVDGRQGGVFARPSPLGNVSPADPRLAPARAQSQTDATRDPRLQRRG